MDDIDFSVIIPVYNVEKYLHRCIESVLLQENNLFEVILVDDGSTDSCPAICDEYMEKDSRVHVIHKRNEGLGYARNSGVEIARGKYIFFLDSDDWIPERTLESLKRLTDKYRVDIISFKYIQTYKVDYFSISNECEKVVEVFKPDIIKAYLDTEISTTACSKIYRKSIFEFVQFSNIPLYEDAYSMHLFLQEARSLLITNQIYYIQYIRRGSLVQSPFGKKNFISIECGQRLLKFVDEYYPEYHFKALEKLLYRQLYVLTSIIKGNVYRKYKQQYLAIISDIKSEMATFPRYEYHDKLFWKKIAWMLDHPFGFIIKTKGILIREKIGLIKIRLCQCIAFISRKVLDEKTNQN
jgi:glycosyltransferase involved in cell wall biosynthesis